MPDEWRDLSGCGRTVDELPQSASGKSIMTTEPKFVPKEAAEIQLAKDVSVLVRLIDCSDPYDCNDWVCIRLSGC